MDRRLGLRLQGCRVRAIAGHGVVSTGAQTPGLLGFQHPETTPPSIPTTPRTAPVGHQLLAIPQKVRLSASRTAHYSERASLWLTLYQIFDSSSELIDSIFLIVENLRDNCTRRWKWIPA